ncbi:hypothetical protein Vafri_22039 [Volvox africanus]|uniref:Mannosyltransferase putative-domain-containing protein n=1 Tax=Volvox africanus TaxID=51714 RepID=A0A8J4FC50_9CHLO|nr:hypothetical protein Vafri_22039 [Volvox africanus]
MAFRLRRLSLRQGLIFIICIPTICIYLLGRRQQWLEKMKWSGGPKCIGWKATFGCIPLGPRVPSSDKTCAAEVRGGSGYCLCEDNITVARVSCGPHRFRCREKCAQLAVDPSAAQVLPKPLTCSPYDGYDMARLVPAWAAYIAEHRAEARGEHERRVLSGGDRAAADGDGANIDSTVSSSSSSSSSSRSNNRIFTSTTSTTSPTDGRGSGATWPWGELGSDAATLSHISSLIWDIVDEVVGRNGLGDARIPDTRIRTNDWVREGRRMRTRDVEKLKASVAGLLRDLPPYPNAAASAAAAAAATEAGNANDSSSISGSTSTSSSSSSSSPTTAPGFSGRGVVMVGGGMRYLTPAWTSLHVLRRTGCKLPVELWFPVEEFPTPAVEEALLGLGVMSCRLSARDLAQRGYGVKVAALLLSSFQEVLFLDSDNAVLRDPTYLFESEAYVSTGALLWPDYWDRTATPEVAQILNISASLIPAGSFESGQMVIDKARHWRGLVLAAYMNVYGAVFSELLSCYIGKGDKETFAYGMLAAGETMWVSPVNPGSVGLVTVVCSPPGRATKCREQFLGNTMVQYGTDGLPLFFHANYHKWDLALPDSFEKGWNRRWQVLQPNRRSVAEVIYSGNVTGGAGYDVERFVYDTLRAFRCASWFDSYHAARVRMGETTTVSLDGFHPVPDYITFREFYRAGWSGNFEDLVHPPLRLGDRLVSWYYEKPRWWFRRLSRDMCRLRKRVFPSWLRCKSDKRRKGS